jgi:AcrR family transcriptional regulator
VPRPRTHDDALRERLLVEAGRELSARGPQGLSLRSVAARAGTSTTAVYSLFGGRTELLRAVFDEAFRRFGAHLAAVTPSGDAREDLVRLGLAYRASAHADPHFYAIMFGGQSLGLEPSQDSVDRALATFSPLVVLVRRGVEAGDLRDEAPRRIATALWASVHGFVSLELAGLLPPDDESDATFAAGARAAVDGWASARARSGHIAPN